MGEAFIRVLAVHVLGSWVASCGICLRPKSAGAGACDMPAWFGGDGIGNYFELS